MKRIALALIDGEHYPAVVVEALRNAADRYEIRAAVFLGGAEKLRSQSSETELVLEYGLPVVVGDDPVHALRSAIARFAPEVVVDLSDEPVLGYEQRFRLISESLARNVEYVGPDFHFSSPARDRLCSSPSLAVIGTGKRVGKTAVSAYAARIVEETSAREGVVPVSPGPAVVIVAMGRGGPAEPEVVDGRTGGLTAADLLRISRLGRHAASDYIEDAVLARVVTVGCRRCGGGLAGSPFASNVREGVRVANELRPGFVILEGSGAALPPVASDAKLLVAGAHQEVAQLTGYLGRFRLLVSDGLVLTMAEEPLASEAKVRELVKAVREVKPEVPVVPVVFRPRPAGEVKGRRVVFFSTAPEGQEEALGRYLEEHCDCRVEMVSSRLADRAALREALAGPALARAELVLTEIKAASIEVVVEEADRRGLPVVFVENLPQEAPGVRAGELQELVEGLIAAARERFERGA